MVMRDIQALFPERKDQAGRFNLWGRQLADTIWSNHWLQQGVEVQQVVLVHACS